MTKWIVASSIVLAFANVAVAGSTNDNGSPLNDPEYAAQITRAMLPHILQTRFGRHTLASSAVITSETLAYFVQSLRGRFIASRSQLFEIIDTLPQVRNGRTPEESVLYADVVTGYRVAATSSRYGNYMEFKVTKFAPPSRKDYEVRNEVAILMNRFTGSVKDPNFVRADEVIDVSQVSNKMFSYVTHFRMRLGRNDANTAALISVVIDKFAQYADQLRGAAPPGSCGGDVL